MPIAAMRVVVLKEFLIMVIIVCYLFWFFSSDIDICKKRAEGNPSTLKLYHFFELFFNYPSLLEFKEAIFGCCLRFCPFRTPLLIVSTDSKIALNKKANFVFRESFWIADNATHKNRLQPDWNIIVQRLFAKYFLKIL